MSNPVPAPASSPTTPGPDDDVRTLTDLLEEFDAAGVPYVFDEEFAALRRVLARLSEAAEDTALLNLLDEMREPVRDPSDDQVLIAYAWGVDGQCSDVRNALRMERAARTERTADDE